MNTVGRRSGELRDFSRSLPMSLMRAREAVMARFRPLLRRHGVTEQQWRVLRALDTVDEARASEIAEATCLSLPSLSRILRGLEQRSLVRRRVRSSDLRNSWISMSRAGSRLVTTVGRESELRYAEIETQLGKRRLAALYDLLDNLAETRPTN